VLGTGSNPTSGLVKNTNPEPIKSNANPSSGPTIEQIKGLHKFSDNRSGEKLVVTSQNATVPIFKTQGPLKNFADVVEFEYFINMINAECILKKNNSENVKYSLSSFSAIGKTFEKLKDDIKEKYHIKDMVFNSIKEFNNVIDIGLSQCETLEDALRKMIDIYKTGELCQYLNANIENGTKVCKLSEVSGNDMKKLTRMVNIFLFFYKIKDYINSYKYLDDDSEFTESIDLGDFYS
jgi:hypothetical protein